MQSKGPSRDCCCSHILIDCNDVEDDVGNEPEASRREPNNGMAGVCE